MTSGTEKRERTAHVTVRLSPAERSELDGKAEAEGLTVSSYIRQIALGGPPPRQGKRRPHAQVDLVRLLGQVGKIGSNLNQVARRMNAGDSVSAAEIQDTLAGLHRIRELVLSALGHSK